MDRMPRVVRHTRIDTNERPFMVIWETTRACDLACVHCRANAQTEPSPHELDHEQAKDLLEQIAAFGDPHPLFVITGGDPFKRRDLFDLIRHARSLGLPVGVSPSGTPTLTRENLTAVRDAGARAMSLSVDGADAATHDRFRQVPGVFDWTIGGWKLAREIGLKVQINTTVTPANLHQLPDILSMVADLGAMTWSIFMLVPTGRGAQLDQLSVQEFEDVLNFCYDADRIISVKTTEAPSFRRVVVQRQILAEEGLDPVSALGLGETYQWLRAQLEQRFPGGGGDRIRRPPLDINAGRGFVFVSHTGDVYPSGFLPRSGGNVRDTPLGDIYRDAPAFRRLRDSDRLGGRCGACEFNAVCGGSRSRAYGSTGDMYASEPQCAYEPGSFGRPERVAQLLG